MKKYDPKSAPEPLEWLELDEQERISLAEAYHKAAKVKLPNLTLHAAFHVMVENQIAEGYPSTLRAVARLMKEGLPRHDAIHAISSVVAGIFFETSKTKNSSDAITAQERFDQEVERLTVKEWKRLYG